MPHELLSWHASPHSRSFGKGLRPTLGGAASVRVAVERATVFPIERVLRPRAGLGHAFVGVTDTGGGSQERRVLGVLRNGGAAAPEVWCPGDQLMTLPENEDGIEMMGFAVPRLWARSAIGKVRPGQAVALKMERCDACFELIRIARSQGILVTVFAVPDLAEACYAAGAHSVRLQDEGPTIGEQEFDHVFDFGGVVSLRRARSILAEDGQYWTANVHHVSRLQRLKGQFLLGRRYRLLKPDRTAQLSPEISTPPALVMPHREYSITQAAEVLRDFGGIPPWRMVVRFDR